MADDEPIAQRFTERGFLLVAQGKVAQHPVFPHRFRNAGAQNFAVNGVKFGLGKKPVQKGDDGE